MRKSHTFLFTLLASLLTLACDPGPVDVDDDLRRGGGVTMPPVAGGIRSGQQWGACDLTLQGEPGWWGCDGSLGEGLACLMPVSEDTLSICAPQTWDPLIDDDCNPDGVFLTEAPFGLGVRVQGSAYCVPDCITDADCGEGRACSPSSHFCAWVH